MNKRLGKEDREVIERFFIQKGLPLDIALTFDDVALPDSYSKINSRSEINDFSAKLLPNLTLNIPIVSANMRSIAGPEMIVAIEREGGLGIVPQDLLIKNRLDILQNILRAECAVIDEPLMMSPETTLSKAIEQMELYGISGLLVVDENKKLLGILSFRDWCYEIDKNKPISELMTSHDSKQLITAAYGISLESARELLKRHKIEKLPLVDKNFKVAGLVTGRGLFYKNHHPRALRDELGRFIRIGSVGVIGQSHSAKNILREVDAQISKGVIAILVDTARAFSENTKKTILAIQKRFGVPLIVGNVSSSEGVKFLLDLGVECVKVGQGPGSVCTTREVGVGLPQLSAICQAAALARYYGKTIIADGGIRGTNDIGKALIAGASAVMVGGLFAGTEESASQSYMYYSEEFKTYIPVKDYYGSASFEAQTRRKKEGTLSKERRPEGIKKIVPLIGHVSKRINHLIDGLKSLMSYFGAKNIKELQEIGYFVRQSNAGYEEGTKKRLNY